MSREARRQRQKEFVKAFNQLVGKYAPWQIWCDMVWMYACAIANSIPSAKHREKREKLYLDIVKRYEREEMTIFVELIGQVINTMEISVSNESEFGDFLGELFMELNLGNNLGGQFFTPYSLCVMMAKVDWNDSIPQMIADDGYISVNDCACGAGATLIAFAQVCRENGVDYQRDVLFVGQDIDSTTALMCYIQLSLLGCAGYVKIGDTLTEPMAGHVLFGDGTDSTWYTPMYYSDSWTWRQTLSWMRAADRAAGKRANAVETPKPLAELPPPERLADGAPKGFTVSAKRKNEGQIMFDFGG